MKDPILCRGDTCLVDFGVLSPNQNTDLHAILYQGILGYTRENLRPMVGTSCVPASHPYRAGVLRMSCGCVATAEGETIPSHPVDVSSATPVTTP